MSLAAVMHARYVNVTCTVEGPIHVSWYHDAACTVLRDVSVSDVGDRCFSTEMVRPKRLDVHGAADQLTWYFYQFKNCVVTTLLFNP